MKVSNSTAKLHLVSSSTTAKSAQGKTGTNPVLRLAATTAASNEITYDPPDPAVATRLERELLEEQSFDRLAELLTRVDSFPPKSVALNNIFFAAKKLTRADSELLRFAAYRRLAGLHRIDFRFENKARLILRDCLENEHGFARKQLERLVKTC